MNIPPGKNHTWLLPLLLVLLLLLADDSHAFYMTVPPNNDAASTRTTCTGSNRRTMLRAGAGGIFGLPFLGGNGDGDKASANTGGGGRGPKKYPTGPTNEVVKVVNGMKRRRLGGSDIVVSELGLGTQRWVSSDFNAPDKDLCYEFMDEAILKRGVNLIDTAEQVKIL